MELQIEIIVVKNSDRESERERCHGRGWGLDLRGGFSGRKIGGGGFIKTVEEEKRRDGVGERERWKASECTGC